MRIELTKDNVKPILKNCEVLTRSRPNMQEERDEAFVRAGYHNQSNT